MNTKPKALNDPLDCLCMCINFVVDPYALDLFLTASASRASDAAECVLLVEQQTCTETQQRRHASPGLEKYVPIGI